MTAFEVVTTSELVGTKYDWEMVMFGRETEKHNIFILIFYRPAILRSGTNKIVSNCQTW